MNPAFQETLVRVRERLLAERGAHGHWEGELSSSALSTATAVIALALVDRGQHAALIQRGLAWLTAHANADGGWGDTVLSRSNISTTTLCWAAFGLLNKPAPAAEAWLVREAGSVEPEQLAQTIIAGYGKDRTFSVPILTACALAGRVAWKDVLPLPFELTVLPHQLFRWLRLPVVSYALPALIAIGQVRHHHLPERRWLRDGVRAATLRVLEKIQPVNGGFLEAAPLTSFVVMALAGMGQGRHPVAVRGVRFLVKSVRADGSWPIDTNLATWLATLAVNALGPVLPVAERAPIGDWLLGQQYRNEHPFTHAAPGGWAWTDLPGGVPDADDTAGALLALKTLDADERGLNTDAIQKGIGWLLDLQNRNGGMPTFCKGWGALPFDRSTPDITAHALRAWAVWRDDMPPPLQGRIKRATRRAIAFLTQTQRADGAWSPLWFGNQHAPNDENLTCGTAQVLLGLQALNDPQTQGLQDRAMDWLLAAQNSDGSWGGATQTPPSIEETALAVNTLAVVPRARDAVLRGVDWLIAATAQGRETPAAPIGLYFAKLWYFERLYPLIFLVGALERVATFPALEK
ncbi:MAG: squalene--hopene cyclase [Verrucomicrobia bacterium]|nr:MAG: squalene--hopene cyclase [Verrucomicrobiota bacterium]